MLRFLDCNAAIGRWKHPRPGGYERATELEAILDYLQVEQAVVYHAQAQETHAPMGNSWLLAELTGHPRLLPSWLLLPHHTGEMPEPEVLLEQMSPSSSVAGLPTPRADPTQAVRLGAEPTLDGRCADSPLRATS